MDQYKYSVVYRLHQNPTSVGKTFSLNTKQVGKLGCTHVAGTLAGLQMLDPEELDFFCHAVMVIFAYMHITEQMVSHLKLQNEKDRSI